MFRSGRHRRPNPSQAAVLFGAVDEVGIVVFFGALEADNLDLFRDELRSAPRPLRIDLGLVDRIDAAGLHALLELDDTHRDATGVGLDLTSMSLSVERALAQAGFAHHLTTEPHQPARDLEGDGERNAG